VKALTVEAHFSFSYKLILISYAVKLWVYLLVITVVKDNYANRDSC
jgi:hypothetical protein